MLNASINEDQSANSKLCLACGLCCNGVIFADVKLAAGDNAERLKALGLPLEEVKGRKTAGGQHRLLQPCAAFDGSRCRVYAERPGCCRKFECVLLKSVNAGRTSAAEGLRVIYTARERAENVQELLQELGDTDEQINLAARFRRTTSRLEKIGLDERLASIYGELTLAVHDLNLLLSEAFYPGS